MTKAHGYLVLANDRAGRLQADDPLVGALDVLRDAGPTETVWLSGDADLAAALHRADGRTLVVAGGDGSINRVVNGLLALSDHGAGPPVGVLPLGTGNDVCRGLGIPLDPVEAAAAIVAGTPRLAPVLETSLGRVAVNAVHVGLGARAAERAAALKSWAGPLAYTVGGVVEGLAAGGQRLRVEVDGAVVADAEPVLLLAVSNGPSVGGGTPLAPDADLTEPVAQVRLVGALPRHRRPGLGWAVVRHRVDGHPAVRRVDGRHVQVATADGAEMAVNVDGELCRADALEVTLRPAAWRVVTPPAPRSGAGPGQPSP